MSPSALVVEYRCTNDWSTSSHVGRRGGDCDCPLVHFLPVYEGFRRSIVAPSYCISRVSLVDVGFATCVVSLATVYISIQECFSRRCVFSYSLILAWGLRLIVFFIIRRVIRDVDHNKQLLHNSKNLIVYGVIRGAAALFLSFSFYLMTSSAYQPLFGTVDSIGLAIAITGLAIEALADAQRLQSHVQGKPKAWCSTGLWGLSVLRSFHTDR